MKIELQVANILSEIYIGLNKTKQTYQRGIGIPKTFSENKSYPQLDEVVSIIGLTTTCTPV
jgi:hypothetical protein